MLTRTPGLISLRFFPFMLAFLSPFGSGRDARSRFKSFPSPRLPCRDVLRRYREKDTWLRFPACHIVVHLVRCPVALDDATGLAPEVLVSAGRCPGNDDVIRGGGRIVNAHGDPLNIARDAVTVQYPLYPTTHHRRLRPPSTRARRLYGHRCVFRTAYASTTTRARPPPHGRHCRGYGE